ncbi:MAG: hypothetical protein HY680_07975 [Chloroflexi bacterium]|nr:hypothetical protein [Chloroflexota bacterium]
MLRKYLGGAGLGFYYLLKEAPATEGATDQGAPLLFMLGPLTGTPVPNSSDWTTVSSTPLSPIPLGQARLRVLGRLLEASRLRRHPRYWKGIHAGIPVG